MRKFCISILAAVVLTGLSLAVTPRTLTANFDGENANKIYTVHTPVGIGTTFRLPDGVKILDFVVSDSKLFFGQSNGTIACVKALEPNKETSVVIHTGMGETYVFLLSSQPSEQADALVVVDRHDQNFFRATVATQVQSQIQDRLAASDRAHQQEMETKLEEQRRQLQAKVDTRYRIHGAAYPVSRVCDDGVFTYIYLPTAQNRPAVFLRGKGKKDKEIEPLKYTDAGEYYQVHYCLSDGEALVLKLDNKTTEITRED